MRTPSAAVLCMSIAMPFAALADMSDADRCQALSQTCRTVVGMNAAAAGNVPEAMAGCASNPASSMPTLEQALRDNKVDLPER